MDTITPKNNDEGQTAVLRSSDWLASFPLGVGNRDGDAFAVKTSSGKHYLVLQADTFHNKEVFPGMGSTEHVEISSAAFAALTNIGDVGRAGNGPTQANQP